MNCAGVSRSAGTNAISTRWCSPSRAGTITCGVQSTRVAMCSISSCKAGVAGAAQRFFRKLLKGLRYAPRVLITGKLKSYAAAKKHIMPGVEHRQHKGLNNRAEISHQPTRQREKQMRRFKSPGHAQRFLSAYGPINNVFRCQRNRLSAQRYRHVRADAFSLWNEVTGVDNIL